MDDCNFEPQKCEHWIWKLLSILVFPLLVAFLGYIGTEKANNISRDMNKSSLLQSFKLDLVKGSGAEYVLARKALRPYFDNEEWRGLLSEIVKAKDNEIQRIKNSSSDKKIATKKAINDYLTIFNQDPEIIKELPASLQLRKNLKQNEQKIWKEVVDEMPLNSDFKIWSKEGF